MGADCSKHCKKAHTEFLQIIKERESRLEGLQGKDANGNVYEKPKIGKQNTIKKPDQQEDHYGEKDPNQNKNNYNPDFHVIRPKMENLDDNITENIDGSFILN